MASSKDTRYQMTKLIPIIHEIMEELGAYCEDWSKTDSGYYLRNPKALHSKWMLVVGSFRRKAQLFRRTERLMRNNITVGDIEIALVEKNRKVTSKAHWDNQMFGVGGSRVELKGKNVFSQGELYDYLFHETKKAESNWKVRVGKDDKKVFGASNKLLLYKDHYKIDLFSCSPENFVSTVFIRTGSKNNNVSVMTQCKNKGIGFSFQEGWFEVPKNHARRDWYRQNFGSQYHVEANEIDTKTERYFIDSEEMIYKFLELNYKKPGER